MVELRRQLGLKEALALGIGGTIGGGIFVLVGTAAGVAGPAVLLSFSLAFIASLSIALPYAELASRYPSAGGGYAFAHSVLGRGWGFFMGWGYWGAYLFISGYVTLGFGGYLQALTGIPVSAGAVGVVAFCTLLNLAGMRTSGRTQTLVIVLAVSSLLAFSVAGLPKVRASNLSPFMPNGLFGVLFASLFCFLAFGGFDIVAAAGEEVTDPRRNLPRAIILTLAIVLGVYLLVAYVAVGTLPWQELASSAAPLSLTASDSLWPSFGPTFVALAAVLTTAATANAVLVVTSRIMFAMAREGVFPRALSRVSRSRGTPWASVIACGALMAAVGGLGSVALVTAVGGFLYVVHFIFPLAAVVKLRRADARQGERGSANQFRMPFAGVLLPAALGLCAVLIVASGVIGVLFGSLWLALGGAISLTARARSRSEQPLGHGRLNTLCH
jgi:APA family basic amino acid/polyamine antiporter